ncbi:cytochrome P450 [Saccharopolyspora oryzae]|uniref:Cytochrome P450 n=1 Tax=Saccharopolyspora oryzae TaxID=2997343 RepID=A0ABT4V775_9PSEU|nr:cytochrome P450 [Saccharopolyspora oryzae]MDA3629251.1 cytochrome P450 [Saccharopolyspora oryzae]
MGRLRSTITGLFARLYLARARRKGLSSVLPAAALMPLQRTGLDPVPALGEVREREPISRLDLPFAANVWLVTGYDEAKAVLGDAGRFSNDFTNLVGYAGVTAEDNPGGLGFTDPPAHTRLRRLLTPEFTMRRLARLTPEIEAIVQERLDVMAAADQPVDLVTEFAVPIPSLVISELLGVPYGDREEFQQLSVARFDVFDGVGASLGAMSQSMEYLHGVVRRQREEPGEGLLGALIRDHGDEVSDRELAELADGVLTGGFETTASMLALGALVLLEDRELLERVRDDDEVVPGLVEELLRYLTVVQVAFPRFAREDVEVAGVRIERGDVVLCSLSGADRDDVLGPGMEAFDADRRPTSHLAFGHGLHRCIGAELARMELRAAYPALVRRFPDIRLAVPAAELEFRKASIVYGLDSLPVHVK